MWIETTALRMTEREPFTCDSCYHDAEGVCRIRCDLCRQDYRNAHTTASWAQPWTEERVEVCGGGIDQFVHCTRPRGHAGPCRSGNWE